MMKLAILTLSVLSAATARPSASIYGPYVRVAQDGGAYSYSYQTPSSQNYVQAFVQPAQVFRSAYVQSAGVSEPHSFVVGPQVSYSFGRGGHALGHDSLRTVHAPANIQVSSDGFVLDTDEVAQARAEHLAAVASESQRAGASASSSDDDGSYDDTVEVGSPVIVKTFAPANIQVAADGHVIDTAEVAQARAEHLARFAAESAQAQSGSVATFGFSQPINVVAHNAGYFAKSHENANIQVGADGHVIDTAEVAQARAQHLAQFAAESSRANSDSSSSFGFVQPISVVGHTSGNYAKSHENANIQVGADGHVIDTAEVAQARAEHLSQFAAEASRVKSRSSDIFGTRNYAKSHENANIQIGADGHVIDTAEVAQARAEHLSQFAAESSRVKSGSSATFGYVQPINVVGHSSGNYAKSHENANIQIGADGHVIDTAEVAHARAEHLSHFATKSAGYSSGSGSVSTFGFAHPINVVAHNPIQYVKSNEIANVRLSADGHVLDTPEVEQAKAAHFAQYASDAARAAAAGGDTQDYSDSSSDDAESVAVEAFNAPTVNNVYKISDAPADIKVSSDGFVLDTAEVAQAKAEHLAKLAAAGSSGDDYSEDTGNTVALNFGNPSYVAYTSPSVAYTSAPFAYAQAKWTGPEADIQVGADGYLLDTPEVQQAKSEHLASRNAFLAGSSGSSSWSGVSSRYAPTQITPGGEFLLDTPEVAAARAAHLIAHAKQSARVSSSSSSGSHSETYGQLVYSAPTVRTSFPSFGYSFAAPAYNLLRFRYAPTASPVALTADGQFLLDTPEVASAKAAHFAAHARARGY